MLRCCRLWLCAPYYVPRSAHVGIFPLHLDPPTVQHRQIFRLLLGHYGPEPFGADEYSLPADKQRCAHGRDEGDADVGVARGSAGRAADQQQGDAHDRFWYMKAFATSLREDSQLTPFDDLILIPNTRNSVGLRRSTHLAALAVLSTRGLPHVHVDFTALEHPDEAMPIVRALTRQYPSSVIVHWLHDAYEMQNWADFGELKLRVPLLLLQTQTLSPAALTHPERARRSDLRPHTWQYHMPQNHQTMSREERAYYMNVIAHRRDLAQQQPFDRACQPHGVELTEHHAGPSARQEMAEADDAAQPPVSDGAAATQRGRRTSWCDYVPGPWWRTRGGRGDDVVEVSRHYSGSEGSSWLGISRAAPRATGDAVAARLSDAPASAASAADKRPAGNKAASAVDKTQTHATAEATARGGGGGAGTALPPSKLRSVRQLIEELYPAMRFWRNRSAGMRSGNSNTMKGSATRGGTSGASSPDTASRAEEEEDGDARPAARAVPGSLRVGAAGSGSNSTAQMLVPMVEVHPVTRCSGADVRQALWDQELSPAAILTDCVQRYVESHALYRDSRKVLALSSNFGPMRGLPTRTASSRSGSMSHGTSGARVHYPGEDYPPSVTTTSSLEAPPPESGGWPNVHLAHAAGRAPNKASSRSIAGATSSWRAFGSGNTTTTTSSINNSSSSGYGFAPHRLQLPRDMTTSMSFPGVIPRLELHYDRNNLLAREQYETLKVFSCRDGDEPDLIVPIGGDGYMMHCIRKNWRRFIPFYGVNAGHVGYLLNDRSTLEELFASALKLYSNIMLYCQAEGETESGEQVLLSELAFNDAWIERSSGQTALIRILVNGEERIRRLRGDGVLVSTAAGSTAYSRALGASPLPVGTPLIQVVGSNVVSPAQWKPVHLNQEDQVEFEVIDTAKRPCRCYVDSVNVGNVKRVLVRSSRVACVSLAFSQSFDLQQKLYQIQFLQNVH